MMQGLLQRSSHAAARLRMKSPRLYEVPQRNGNLHLLYFLLEEPLKKHIEAICYAERDLVGFQNTVVKKYKITKQ